MSTSTRMDKGLDTKVLEDALTALLGLTRVTQYYVIANDEMRTIDFDGPFPYAIIQNIDDANRPGTHWVAYYLTTKKKFTPNGKNFIYFDFFDSYGERPEFYDLEIPPEGRIQNYNRTSLQSEDSSLCGQYSLHFLYNMAIGLGFPKYMDLFKNKSPDGIVKRFYDNLSFYPSRYTERTCQYCCTRRACMQNIE